MEREEEEEMLREKRSLQCRRDARSPAHPSGGTSLGSGGCGTAGPRHPPCARGSRGPGSGGAECQRGVPRGQRDRELPERNQSSGSSGIPARMVPPSLGVAEVLCWVADQGGV